MSLNAGVQKLSKQLLDHLRQRLLFETQDKNNMHTYVVSKENGAIILLFIINKRSVSN